MKKKQAFALACIFVLLAVLATGCGSSSGGYNGKTAADHAVAMPQTEAYSESYGGDGMQYSDNPDLAKTDGDALPADPSLKMVYTVDLSVETLDYDKSLQTVESLTAQYGGYVEYAQTENNKINSTRLRSAYYTLRVPAAQLSAFLDSCGAVGNVCSSTRSTENRTAEYADLDARLKTLRVEEESLQALLEKAEDLDTVVALHSYLSDVRYSIERVEASMRGIDSLVSYSTVHLNLSEVRYATDTVTPASTFGERLRARSSEAWRDFGESLEDFSVFLLGELPSILVTIILYLLPIAIVVFIIIVLVRRGRKKRRARRAAQQQYAQQPYVQPQPEQTLPPETPKE
jgi:hypothetical protein